MLFDVSEGFMKVEMDKDIHEQIWDSNQQLAWIDLPSYNYVVPVVWTTKHDDAYIESEFYMIQCT
jgi:hypothetical protein